MISVCFFILCFSLQYTFDQAEMITPTKAWQRTYYRQQNVYNSLTNTNQDDFLANTISPYWKLAYNEQLEKKQNRSNTIVDIIFTQSETLANRKTFKLHKIVPSPVTKGYRSKDEFTVWYGLDGNPKTVGIRIGRPSIIKPISFHTTKAVTIKESHKRVAQIYEDYIRLSPLRPSFIINDGGHWRSLIVRSNEAGEIIALVIVQPKGFSYNILQNEQKNLRDYFYLRLPNITLLQQKCVYTRCTENTAKFILLYGNLYILEYLKGYKFQITPYSFFPINKWGAEMLYDTVISTAKLNINTTVIDIGSGIGLTSMMVSKYVRKVIGFEDMQSAHSIAKENVEANNIHNIDYQFGIMERHLTPVLEKLKPSSDIVVIVNSADKRPGLDVIRTIRNSPQLSRLVYISGKAESINNINNFYALCSNTTSTFPPFTLTKAIPVDTLPQTLHIELVMLFER